MKYIKRNKNVITHERTLEKLKIFKSFPVFIGCTNKSKDLDIKADLSISICKKTGIIQLDKLLPLDIVYSEYHSEALGKIWKEHHDCFVDFLAKYKPQKILEIGGSNGYIGREYLKKNKNTNWIIVDPIPAVEANPVRMKVIKKIFDNNFTLNEKVDTIVHSHLFEHLYNPTAFLNIISRFMEKGNLHIFTVPNLYQYFKNKYTNWINFEHTVFLSDYYIEFFLKQYGFEILEKKYFQKHSIFYATRKIINSKMVNFKIKSKYKENKKMFNNFISHYQNKISRLNKEILRFSEVYLFGAHIFSQFLLEMGLKGAIVNILDNSKIKQGKRLYGTNLIVAPFTIIKKKKNIAVILNAGVYQKEIKFQLLKINKNVTILE